MSNVCAKSWLHLNCFWRRSTEDTYLSIHLQESTCIGPQLSIALHCTTDLYACVSWMYTHLALYIYIWESTQTIVGLLQAQIQSKCAGRIWLGVSKTIHLLLMTIVSSLDFADRFWVSLPARAALKFYSLRNSLGEILKHRGKNSVCQSWGMKELSLSPLNESNCSSR